MKYLNFITAVLHASAATLFAISDIPGSAGISIIFAGLCFVYISVGIATINGTVK